MSYCDINNMDAHGNCACPYINGCLGYDCGAWRLDTHTRGDDMNHEIEREIAVLENYLAGLAAKYEGSDKAMWPPIKRELEQRIERTKRKKNIDTPVI